MAGRPIIARSVVAIAAAAAVFLLGAPAAAASGLPPLAHLTPGAFLDAHQDVPVTVVFVGLEPGANPTGIDAARLLAPQLSHATVRDRTTRFYEQNGVEGLEPSRIGLTYDYDYRTVFAGSAFEDAFFGYLASIALGPIPGGTIYQQAYSADPLAALQIPYDFIVDATAAERWLADHAGALGVDTTRPTVFFVNWFGRPDFRFHTYGFFGTRPGWSFPIGLTQGGQMIGFGGSAPDTPYGALGRLARVWFYDLSAGPEYNTSNWALSIGDFDGDGVAEDRLPPIWEYGTTHWFRPFDDLTGDLAKLLRFVAVDELFGSAPIYDPAVSEPLLPETVQLDLNFFGRVPGQNPAATVDIPHIPASLSLLDPTRSFTTETEVHPLDGRLADVYACQQSANGPTPRSCYGNAFTPDPGNPFYDLDVYFWAHQGQYLEGTRYEMPFAAFDTVEPPAGAIGFASFRSPNLQGWIYAWLFQGEEAFGFDRTGTLTHEAGHHLGLSHVHDTYDSGLDAGLEGVGPFFLLWAGDESATGMSYLPNTNEFSQFDRDHMARWQLAARLDNANRILGLIAKSPRAELATAATLAADAKAGEALAALHAWDLPHASAAALEAYRLVLLAAGQANVKVEPWSGVADESHGRGVIAAATDPRTRALPVPFGAANGLAPLLTP